ncbi:hypothetical protein GCM10028808_25880 [Spirosoma migulaei]
MNAIRIRTQVSQNHELILRNLPLSGGKKVEVIILEDDMDTTMTTHDRFPLRGKAITFENPFDAAANETDWEAAQ